MDMLKRIASIRHGRKPHCLQLVTEASSGAERQADLEVEFGKTRRVQGVLHSLALHGFETDGSERAAGRVHYDVLVQVHDRCGDLYRRVQHGRFASTRRHRQVHVNSLRQSPAVRAWLRCSVNGIGHSSSVHPFSTLVCRGRLSGFVGLKNDEAAHRRSR
jgi:hypothetical protein